MGRAPCCDKAKVKKGPWSPEEDAKLKDFIEKDGTGGNWISLPQKAGLKRCGKSCRLRWLNYLRPNIKHGEFSEDEDRIICSLYATIGSRWSIIAGQLPGRTDNDIKNYWNTKLKKKIMARMLIPSSSSSKHMPIISSPSPLFSASPPPPCVPLPTPQQPPFSFYTTTPANEYPFFIYNDDNYNKYSPYCYNFQMMSHQDQGVLNNHVVPRRHHQIISSSTNAGGSFGDENQGHTLFLEYGNNHGGQFGNNGGSIVTATTTTHQQQQMQYDVEFVREQLVSSSSSGNGRDNNINNDFLLFDYENKMDEKAWMYLY